MKVYRGVAMWVFIIVGAIPFVVVFGIIVYNVIHAGMDYNKTKKVMYNMITNAIEKTDKSKKCAYCGTEYDSKVCPSCGAEQTKK